MDPDKIYYYWVSCKAHQGNESLGSELVIVKPTVFFPEKIAKLTANPAQWSVALSWQQSEDAQGFIDHYDIYRKDTVDFQKIAESKEPNYTDRGLGAGTTYSYRVVAISIDQQPGQPAETDATTITSNKAPLGIASVNIGNIFSNTYKIYENSGLGQIVLTNNTGGVISNIVLLFTVKEFMDFPSELKISSLAPGESKTLVLKALFNNKLLEITEDTPVQTELKASYYQNDIKQAVTTNLAMNIYEKHRMSWDIKDRFATFITPKDPVLLEFVRSIVTSFPLTENAMGRGAAIYNALGNLGITYMPDPTNPYQITSGATDFVDYIQYPRETLQRKSGDCDDLVALYCSALESIGIKTRVIEVPGHMLMMFSTGELSNGSRHETQDGLFVSLDGELWVVIETTVIGVNFIKAWQKGIEAYEKNKNLKLSYIDHHQAWQVYKPASLPASSWRPSNLEQGKLLADIADELEKVKQTYLRLKCRKYYALLNDNPNNINALTQIGITYGQANALAGAKKAFGRVLAIEPNNVDAINNYANISFLEKDYLGAVRGFEKAVELAPDDNLLKINLVRAYIKTKKMAEAAKLFNEVKKIDPTVAKKNRDLAMELATSL